MPNPAINVTTTTEVGYCPFCGRTRNLRREERHLGGLVRTSIDCESCHRTLSSTIGPPAPKVEPDPAPAPAPEPEKKPEPVPARAATTAKPTATVKPKATAKPKAAAKTPATAKKTGSTTTAKKPAAKKK